MSNAEERYIEYDANGFTLREAIVEAKRCLNCKKPMCRTGCPISNNIPEFIHALAQGDLGQASVIIAERSNLPAVCGRVCPHERQCEGSCILGRKGQGIRIGKLERFIADMDGELELVSPKVAKAQPGNIAVIGSGPAGLTVAGDLAKMGFKVTVFDSHPEAGGVLMYGIPEFRLPKQVVRREVKKIKKLGVDFRLNIMAGVDITVDDMFAQGFDAIFIGTGNALSKSLPIEGVNLPGVVQATYFLQVVELASCGEIDEREIPIKAGEDVLVIGGGNTAMDAARTAMRQGARSVTIVNRRREEDMAALKSEIEAAKNEGITVRPLLGPVEITGENNKVTGLTCCVRKYDDEADKVVDTEEQLHLTANKVIIAIGQKPASRIVDSTTGIDVDKNGYVITREKPYGMTMRHGVFSGGDVVNGPATVVVAMKDAQKVARGIAQYVEAKKLMEECGMNMAD